MEDEPTIVTLEDARTLFTKPPMTKEEWINCAGGGKELRDFFDRWDKADKESRYKLCQEWQDNWFDWVDFFRV